MRQPGAMELVDLRDSGNAKEASKAAVKGRFSCREKELARPTFASWALIYAVPRHCPPLPPLP